MLTVKKDISALASITIQHSLVVDPAKSVLILFGNRNQVNFLAHLINLQIKNIQILTKNRIKNFRLISDSIFCFKSHVAKCVKTAYVNLNLVYLHQYYLSVAIKQPLCDSLVLFNFAFVS